ncbi:MAG: GTP-binding protein EngB [uncultured Campylobacterales bacterium]|uniref:Probable GTP-binding protein EngB n=1 Tax=uncultured Campylobacterales bacterium TaxID=352960 RepID=A0A6S6STM6_9BACT|nr:MAG: GTP-binding protein EngB [uncultured Campylobacterales bacterium]
MIKIIQASFNKSSQSINDSVYEGISEVVFLGRSNVGKSSFINALTNHKGLAKSSSTPGKTRLINFFDIKYKNDEDDMTYDCRFVDLPGFGYARVSKSEKHQWQKNLMEFIKNRVSLRVYIHLRDARHPALDIDNEVAEFLKTIKRPDQEIVTIFTKSDKLNQSSKSKLLRQVENSFAVSNVKKSNINKANEKVFNLLFT